MKLYLGIFHYFATGEGHHIIVASFLTEGFEREDPNWTFYRDHCQTWSHNDYQPQNFEDFQKAWDYYKHSVSTYLLEECAESDEEVTVTTHTLPDKAINELSAIFHDKQVELIVRLAKHGLDKFKYELHYNLS